MEDTVKYSVPRIVPLINPLMHRLIGTGLRLGPRSAPMVLLTVTGRKSGQPRTTAVNMFDKGGVRYVLGTFGETDWVRNLRAAREAILTLRGRKILVDAIELPIEEAAPVIREALEPFLRTKFGAEALGRFFDVAPGAPLSAYLVEAGRHPIFELRTRQAAHVSAQRSSARPWSLRR
jgi:deazaflavin-dependent oxidoreductase (nitroreductase family)